MSRDPKERRHRKTWRNAASIEFMAGADFEAVPSLSEAMGLEETTMTADAFRDLMDDVSRARLALSSAVTSHEQRLAWLRLRDAVASLKAAALPHGIRGHDRDRAPLMVASNERTLAAYKADFDRADANLSRLAVGS